MFSAWFSRRRRRALLAEPLSHSLKQTVEKNVRHYQFLSASDRDRLLGIAQVIAAEKTWYGTDDQDITEKMKITVAAQAALLLLGFDDDYYFDGVPTVFMRTGAYAPPIAEQESAGLIVSREETHFGQAFYDGRIVLSWPHVVAGGRDASDGDNLVLHEFAHHLDGLDGEMSGTPLLASRAKRKTWYQITEREYLRLVGNARRGEASLLDHYGATNKAEFFAVSTECFFERPRAMRKRHTELYHVLSDFYQQDPAGWARDARSASMLPDDAPPPPPRPRRKKRRRHELPLVMPGTDGYFTRGIEYLRSGDFEQAWEDFDHVVERQPDDGEAWHHRGEAARALARFEEAVADCSRAIKLDRDDLDAYATRGAALVELYRFEDAVVDLNYVIDNNSEHADAYFQRGRALAGLDQMKRAVRDFSSALAFDPHDAESRYHRGIAYQMLGKRDRSEADLRKALELNPHVAGQ